MADVAEKQDAVDVEKKPVASRSDSSIEKPEGVDAAQEPKAEEPKELDGWTAYWVSLSLELLSSQGIT